MVHQKKSPANSTNGNNHKEYPTMSLSKRDVTEVTRVMGGNSGKGDAKANGNSGGFRTDAAISSSRSGRERTLTPWVAPTGSDSIDLSLETTSTSGGGWDQFAANERQFGIKSTYDENIYTTAIDKSHPQYKERMAHADKKAREIERSPAATAHVAEERKMDYGAGDDAGGGDEEDKYSGVKRQDFPPTGNRENKYTPPARRAPAGNTSVKGAPVDPAIISSQLKTQKAQPAPKAEDSKGRAASKAEASLVPAAQPTDSKPESKGDTQKPAETKPANQNSTPLRPSAATSRTISPQVKDGQNATPSATSTVERDVLKEFKTFANQQRINVEKVRSSKAKADKEVKLIELKKFADSFKLPTPVPVDLISIIAKDPAKQREIQEKAQRDAAEVAKRKADEAAAKEKKGTATKDSQPTTTVQPSSENRAPRPVSNVPAATGAPSGNSGGRHQGGRNYGPSAYPSYPNNRSGPQHMPQTGRLTNRIRALESQKAQGQEVRMPPTGPANAADQSYARRMALPSHMGGKLNPNSHEFRPSAFAPTFSPNGHPSAGSSPRSAINHANESHSGIPHIHSSPVVITKKRKAVDPKKCDILSFVKAIQPPETKNWNDNDGLRPSYDTPPTWRSATDDEKPDSTMRLSYDEYFERQPFNTQPTPNPPHLIPQHVPHQHQLPLHMQHGALNVGPRHSPHVPPVPMHAGQHGPVPHVPFNGDDHRMMHSNSSQSFSSPRMSQVPMAYPSGMNTTPQMPYNQHVMPSFMAPGAPQLGQFNRSLSNNPQYMPQQPGAMGGPMMIQPPFMTPQGMVAGPQMHMYPGGQAFMPPGATPQPMPGTNGYPSPGGRPAAPMMVPQGSQQGQPMFAQSPSMQYQQPFAPQPGQLNMRAYSNAGPQQFGTSPQQIHHYGGPPHRNGSNNFNKNYQGHNQHHGSQGGHAVPTGPQGRASDGPDEAK
ncbi:hypothetical protein F5X96DRAFT_677500 [Biscogniauxia mediterranea]|nr:hypothetical protein F5X96DRAFT_677500 [Biscogniauxia mediterranea]